MTTATLTAPSMNGAAEEGKKTPLINVTQVSLDGKDHEVLMRPKKTPSISTPNNNNKLHTRPETDSPKDSTPRSSIANWYVLYYKLMFNVLI